MMRRGTNQSVGDGSQITIEADTEVCNADRFQFFIDVDIFLSNADSKAHRTALFPLAAAQRPGVVYSAVDFKPYSPFPQFLVALPVMFPLSHVFQYELFFEVEDSVEATVSYPIIFSRTDLLVGFV